MGGSPPTSMPSLYKEAPLGFPLLPPHRPPHTSPRGVPKAGAVRLFQSSSSLLHASPPAPIFGGLHLISKVGIFFGPLSLSLSLSLPVCLCDEQVVSMARFLLACLLAAHIITTAAVVAAGRPLRDADAAAPATAELIHLEGVAAPLSYVGVSLHGGALKIAAGPAAVLRHPQHKSFDKSIAGAEVILGGLATAVIAAVFCYIRVTRRRCQEGPQENKS
ncbi:hypothetical protein Taro_030421 [Colocasia esculenta]|uniref:Uncharacterized protein n=1 Tax=Colocasia esculenta TaxID=4460 RepID=A0A843W054_COLES|nr:hypothetical protein [Colocasia esculenta]